MSQHLFNYDNVVISEIEVLYRDHESEWAAENPIIGVGFGAYSRDTRLIRVGDGTHTWSELENIDPAKYVGPHAYSHMPGGNDELKITSSMMPRSGMGTVFFGTGTDSADDPVARFTLEQAYVCEDEIEVNEVKEVASDQESIFNTWKRYSHSTLGDHYDGSKLIYTCTDENLGYPLETEKWYFDTSSNSIRNTTNSYTPIGLVSPLKYSDYTFETTAIVAADDFDDDSMGVVLAYVKDSNGDTHTLTAYRSIGGNTPYRICVDFGKSTQYIIRNNHATVKWGTGLYSSTAKGAGFWTATSLTGNRLLRSYLFRLGVRFKVVREGNVFTIMTSNFANTGGSVTAARYVYPDTEEVLQNVTFPCDSSVEPLEETKFVIDLDNYTYSYYNIDSYSDDKTKITGKTWTTVNFTTDQQEKLAYFRSPGSIGYTCVSQKNSSWNDIVFITPDTKIYNIETGIVEVPSGSSYVVDRSASIYSDFYPQGKFLYNKVTSKLFYLYNDLILPITVNGAAVSGGSSGSSTTSSKSGFYMFGVEVGDTVLTANTDNILNYNITDYSNTYFSCIDGVFTYEGTSARRMCVVIQQRLVRTSMSDEDLSTAFSIDTKINTSNSAPTSVAYRYSTMGIGSPWVDVTLTMTHTFVSDETFTVTCNPAVEVKTYGTSDDNGSSVPINCISNINIYAID